MLFEAPHRLPEMLADAAAVLGAERPAAVARELTKLFETVRRGTLGGLAATFAEEGRAQGRGRGGDRHRPTRPPEAETDAGLDAALTGGARRATRSRTPRALVADETGQPRRVVYARALALARDDRCEA